MRDKRTLKIWVMTGEYHPHIIGGLGVVATQLSRSLSRSGNSVTVICTGGSTRPVFRKISKRLRILRLPSRSSRQYWANGQYRPSSVLQAARNAGLAKPDVIHVHSTEFAETAAEARRRYAAPIVYTCHSLHSKGKGSASGKRQGLLYQVAKRITVPSRWQAEASIKRYPDARGRIVVIPNGVRRLTRARRKPASKLLYAGRIVASKGIEPLIRAVARLSRHSSSVRLTVIGDGAERYRSRMITLSKQLGVARRIRWIRHQSHESLLRNYSAYGAVVVPSRKESFCLVALEAMARGVPLTSTRSGGLAEFVNASNAQVIRSTNEISIAQAIQKMWNHPGKTNLRVKRARLTASRYLWPVVARRYRSLFSEIRKRG